MWFLKFILTLHLVLGVGFVMSGCMGGDSDDNGAGTNTTVVSEGSVESPVLLTLDTLHNVTVVGYGISYYQIDITEPGLYTLDNPSGAAPDMYIYSDSLYSTLVTSFSSTTLFDFVALDTGTYYIKVSNEIQGIDLSFSITAQFVSAFINEGSITTPVLVSLGSNSIQVDSNIASYYKFSVQNAGYYTLSVVITDLNADGQTTANLYSDTSFSVPVTNDSVNNTPLYQLAAGDYYLKIEATSSATYTLRISSMNEGTTTSPVVLELNTTRTGIVDKDTVYTTSFYTFTTGLDGNYSIVLKSGSDSDFHLYSDAFTTLVDEGVSSQSSGETKVISLSAATQYHLSVDSPATYGAAYSIFVVKTVLGSDGDISASQAITVGTPFSGGAASSSSSYYNFAVPTKKIYNIALEDIATNLEEHIALNISSDSNHSEDYYSSTPGQTANLHQLQLELNTSAAYVKVENGLSIYNVNYDLKVEEQVSNEGATNAPVSLVIDTPLSAKVGIESDISQYSYYKFTLPEAGDYSFTPSSLTSGTDYPKFESGLWGSSYSLYYSNSDSILNISYRGEGTKEVFLKAINNTDYNTTYTLSASQSATATATNEGVVGTPIALNYGLNTDVKVGISSQMAEKSYYSFGGISVVTDGYYEVTSDESLVFSFFSDSEFTAILGTGANVFPLTAGGIAYVRAYNTSLNDIVGNVNINKVSEGSATSPINSLFVDSIYSGIAGSIYGIGSNISYYAYNTSSTPNSATILLSNLTGTTGANLWIHTYSDSSYTTQTDNASADANLTISSPPGIVYFTVTNNSTSNASYDINITGN